MEDYTLVPAVAGPGATVRFSHNGIDEGFEAMWVAYETGQGAVVMTNGSGGLALAQEIVSAIARGYDWPDDAPD